MTEKKEREDKIIKAPATSLAVTPEKLTEEIIHKYICPSATPVEIFTFKQVCLLWGANPFKREIYLIKYDPSSPAQTVIAYEFFLKRAEATNKLKGWRAWAEYDEKDKKFPVRAYIEIYRSDWDKPFVHSVRFSEYAQYKREKDPATGEWKRRLTRFWDEKPETQIKKVAISQGMRLCVPGELGGMPYIAEEISGGEESLPIEPIEVEVVEMKKGGVKEVMEQKSEAPKEREAPLPIETPPDKQEKEGGSLDSDEAGMAGPNQLILRALETLVGKYGRERKELVKRICDKVKAKFGKEVAAENYLDKTTEEEGYWVLGILDKTIQAEYEKSQGK